MCTFTMRTGLASVLLFAAAANNASAQCDTCAQPTVAYQPVVAQPTVAYRPYTGWYPGKLLDQWRLRRAGVGTTAPAYTATYAPSYTAAYSPAYVSNPAYTSAYTPTTYRAAYTPTYTAAYRPYVTSFAPLSAPAAAPCTTCMQTVARPVLMRPVVAPACDACSYIPSCDCGGCGGCDACSSGVSQAVYSEAPACSSCAGGGTVTNVVPPASSGAPSVGPQTSQPDFRQVPEAAPDRSQYQSNRAIQDDGNPAGDDVVPPVQEYPEPAETESDSSTWYNAPQLLDPRDRTAVRTYKSRRPTVDVRTAVYRNPTPNQRVSQTSGRRARTQAEIDADGWSSVPSGR